MGTEGQCRNCLSTADGEDARYAGNTGRRQHQGIALADHALTGAAGGSRSRHHHDDLADTRHMRGYRVHEYRRRVSCLAARNIDSDTVQRRDLLPQQAAIFIAVTPALAAGLFLRFVVGTNSLRREQQRIALRRWNAFKGLLQRVLRKLQGTH